MTKVKRPVNSHKAYHAHVYFDEETKQMANKICNAAGEKFGLRVGRFHEKLVGPHPCWSCQITFGSKDFDSFIPWLEERRQNLTVLVHAITGNDLQDHTEFAYWLGQPVALNLSIFEKN